jgi:transcriptional regulator with XRE-family HTH domain
MEFNQAFGRALRQIRLRKGLSQEDFSDISGRTYLSNLELGKQSPTLEKINQLASVLGVHPGVLVNLTYLIYEGVADVDGYLELMGIELRAVLGSEVPKV